MRTAAVVLFALFALFPRFAQGLSSHRVIALSGQSAPGAAAANFTSFSQGAMNDSGQVAFRANTSAAAGGPRTGFWSEGPGTLQAIALEGQQAPQMPSGTVFAQMSAFSLTDVSLSDEGLTTLFAQFVPGPNDVRASRNDAIWSHAADGTFTLRIRAAAPLPGFSDGTSARFLSRVELSPTGGLAVEAPLSTGPGGQFEDSEALLVSAAPSQLTNVAHTGTIPPPDSDGTRFVYFTPIAISDDGRAAFAATVGNSSGQIVNDFSSELWYQQADGSLALAVQYGDPLPGLPPGSIFRSVVDVALNDSDQILFRGNFDDATNFTRRGYWVWSPQTGPQALAIEGQTIPGTLTGEQFASLFGEITWNNAGQTVLSGPLRTGVGGVTTNNDAAWWRGGIDSPLQLLLREGEPAPGLPGLIFNSTAVPLSSAVPFLNDQGQFAFAGTVRGVGVNTANDVVIWAEDLRGELQVIAREGELFNVGGQTLPDWRTINQLRFSGDTLINDRGQLLFFASFTDGSEGVFVSNRVAVPEPGIASYTAVLAMVSLLQSSRKKRLATGDQKSPLENCTKVQ